MGDTGGQFTQYGQFLFGDQLGAGGLQQPDMLFQFAGFILQGLGTALYRVLQSVGGLLNLAVTLFQQVEHGVKLLRQFTELVVGVHHADPLALTGFNRLHHVMNAPYRVNYQSGAAQDQKDRNHGDNAEGDQEFNQGLALYLAVGLFQKAGVEHTDAFAGQILHGYIGGDIPVVDHKGAVYPALSFAHYGVVNIAGDPGAQRTFHQHRRAVLRLALAQSGIGRGQGGIRFAGAVRQQGFQLVGDPVLGADLLVRYVGADTDIIQKQGDGADAAFGQGAGAVDQITDGIHKVIVAVQQATAVQQSDHLAFGIAHRVQGADKHTSVFGGAAYRFGAGGVHQADAHLVDQAGIYDL